jgi:hypothetical protein
MKKEIHFMKKNMLSALVYSVMILAGFGLTGCGHFGYHKSCCSSEECSMKKEKSGGCKKEHEGCAMKKSETTDKETAKEASKDAAKEPAKEPVKEEAGAATK